MFSTIKWAKIGLLYFFIGIIVVRKKYKNTKQIASLRSQ
jgi:hypothetical protein